jgi:hypothetical protein
VRVLVTGDSHTEGVCTNAESFTHLLEGALADARPGAAVEAINSGLSGYNLYNYLGVLEKGRALGPDVFVVTVYGGNDFAAAVQLYRYFERMPPYERAPHSLRSSFLDGGLWTGAVAQELNQVAYFLTIRRTRSSRCAWRRRCRSR